MDQAHHTVYRAATWLHTAPLLILIWVGVWEFGCIATWGSSSRAVIWTIVNAAIATSLWFRARRMGVMPGDSKLVLRYMLFRRSIPWSRVDRFSLDGGTLVLNEANGRKVKAGQACQFAASKQKEGWLRTHRLAWQGGESDDVLGVLNTIADEHRDIS